jgi:tetratricopeptide (TPR) repeat protein
LKHLRTKRGLTQEEVAAPAYSAAYVSHLEAGKRTPSDQAIRHLAERLGVSTEELVSGIPAWFEPQAELRLQEGWRALYLGHYGEAESSFASVAKDAAKLDRVTIGSKALVGRAWCAERQGQTAEALELFTKAMEGFEAAAPLPARVEAVTGFARCHQMAGNARLAAHILEIYLLDLERHDLLDPGALMRTYASLVWPYMELGLHQRAGVAASKALALRSSVQAPEEIASMHLNVARVLLNEDQPQAALDSLRKAEDIYQVLNWRTEIARARMNRGMVYLSEGELLPARDELQAALETFKEVGFVRAEARALNELARLERLLDRPQAAERVAQQALELLSDMEAVPELALAHRELALIIRARAPKKAEKHFGRAIELYRQCGEPLNAADTHRLLGDLLSRGTEPDAARGEYRKGLLLVAAGLDRRDE